MHAAIGPEVLATEVVMTLAGFDGLIILVEGPTDLLFIENMIGGKDVRCVHAGNKDVAVDALEIINNFDGISVEKKNRVVALVDSDFDRVLGVVQSRNCYLTDFHDLEMTLIDSDAFERWLKEYGISSKMDAFGGVAAVRNKILELGGFLGALRLASLRLNLSVNFKELNYQTYLDKKTLTANRRAICQSLFSQNRKILLDAEIDAERFLALGEAELSRYSGDLRDLVQGHDAIEILALMMRFKLASFDSSIAKAEIIAPALRLALRPEEWCATTAGVGIVGVLRAISA